MMVLNNNSHQIKERVIEIDSKKIIYLGSYKALHKNYNIVYQDINGERDLDGDMLKVDLNPYDIIIATPPCNYYSRARGNKKPSKYAIETKHLLPGILKKLIKLDKPFIVENVRAYDKFYKLGLFNLPLFVYFHGRHTYWTNRMFDLSNIRQGFDFSYNGNRLVKNSQGGNNVHEVIEWWLRNIN
jgi:hypothetical protein